ncbi:MAG: L-threonylcarbamoyladenylate synthase [Candidatus Choladocola sp.]|nr:L-threonylcarbamoyladenylate synthase [Candidatus Choladocola sp.]
MKTKIISITEANMEETAKEAAEIWENGGLVAFPTETVYGLGGNGLNKEASKKIYAAKGRPSDNPLILHIAELKQLYSLIKTENETVLARADALAKAFWPGPLTMILPKAQEVPYETTGGLDTVAVRMPSHPAARALLQASGLPIAAPSANLSGRPSPTSAGHVIEDMDGRIEMIIDGGDVGIGVESTIIDLTGETPMLLRPGFITTEMLETVLGTVQTDAAVYRQVGKDVHPKAPGMKYRHYAPKASMILVEGTTEQVAAYINEETKKHREQGKRIGVMATDESKDMYQADVVIPVGSRTSMDSIAHNLFRVLREFDEENVDLIYSESFDMDGCGFAVMNRLLKAAGHQVVRL